jgi:hypothetical protein
MSPTQPVEGEAQGPQFTIKKSETVPVYHRFITRQQGGVPGTAN